MSNKQDFDLVDEMARGCLYRGGQSETNFLNGYFWGAVLFWGVVIVGSAIEIFFGWLF